MTEKITGNKPAYNLMNDPPKPRLLKSENSDRRRQRPLFLGLNDLPGQQYLIDEVNTEGDE